MSERDAYVKKMKAKLDEWNVDISKLEAKAKVAAAEAQVKYAKQIAEIKGKRDTFQQKLRELQEGGVDAWDALREGAKAAWNELSEAFKNAADKLK